MTTMLKIKNGVIRLPKLLQKRWKGSDIFAHVSKDTVVLKRVEPARFWGTWEQLKPLAKKIARKDITDAIKWARENKRK